MTTAKKRLTQDPERVNPVRPVHIWRSPPGSAVEMLIVTHLEAYSVMHDHATDALPNETGGFLIGQVAFDHRDGCWHIEIEEAVPVAPDSQDPVHFTFTWRDVDRVRSYREGQGKALVGWFHTHPGLGIFLSDTDLDRTHRVLFTEPFQVALVYDPLRGRAGYFFWEAAQAIDPSQADWREFDLAVTPVEGEPIAGAAGAAGDAGDAGDAGAAGDDNAAGAAPTLPPPAGGADPVQSIAVPAVTGSAETIVSGTQIRRLRAIPADAAPTSDPPAPGPHPGPSADGRRSYPAASAHSDTTSDDRRSRSGHAPWLLALLIVVLLVCGAVGYFWLSLPRGS